MVYWAICTQRGRTTSINSFTLDAICHGISITVSNLVLGLNMAVGRWARAFALVCGLCFCLTTLGFYQFGVKVKNSVAIWIWRPWPVSYVLIIWNQVKSDCIFSFLFWFILHCPMYSKMRTIRTLSSSISFPYLCGLHFGSSFAPEKKPSKLGTVSGQAASFLEWSPTWAQYGLKIQPIYNSEAFTQRKENFMHILLRREKYFIHKL